MCFGEVAVSTANRHMLKKAMIAIGLFLVSFATTAHVRWFVDASEIPQVQFEYDFITYLTIFGAISYCIFIFWLNRLVTLERSNFAKSLNRPWLLPANGGWYVLIALLSITLILCLLLGEFLAPNLLLPYNLTMLGLVLQAAVIVILAVSPALAGVGLVFVSFLIFSIFGVNLAIDYFFEFLGVGIALILIGPVISNFDRKILPKLTGIDLERYAFLSLRLGLGFQLMVLGIHNKLYEPGISLLFLEQHSHFNFMQLVGFKSFSHLDFVFAAGLFEFTFGLLVAMGLGTRLVALTLALVFTLTTIVAGVEELVGHMPIFGVLLILILKGPAHSARKSKSNGHVKDRTLVPNLSRRLV